MKNEKIEVIEAEAVTVETVNDDEVLASENRLDEIINDDIKIDQEIESESKKDFELSTVIEAIKNILSGIPIALEIFGYSKTMRLWGDDVRLEIAKKTVPVLEKYPLGIKILKGLNGEGLTQEFALGMVLIPVCFTTYLSIKSENEAMKKEKDITKEANEQKEAGNVANN